MKSIARKIMATALAVTMTVNSVTASAEINNQYSETHPYFLDCGELGYIPDDGLGTPINTYARSFSYLFYLYPNGSYFSKTGTACTCHNSSSNDCDYDDSCDCVVFQNAIQCAGFAKKVYYETHNTNLDLSGLTQKNITLTADKAKELFLNTNQGTCLFVKTKNGAKHYISIITTSNSNVTVYHANYGDSCLVKYESYTWANFVKAFPKLYSYKK